MTRDCKKKYKLKAEVIGKIKKSLQFIVVINNNNSNNKPLLFKCKILIFETEKNNIHVNIIIKQIKRLELLRI